MNRPWLSFIHLEQVPRLAELPGVLLRAASASGFAGLVTSVVVVGLTRSQTKTSRTITLR